MVDIKEKGDDKLSKLYVQKSEKEKKRDFDLNMRLKKKKNG